MTRLYKKAKTKVGDRLRPPSRQSVPTNPARSPRNSHDPTTTRDASSSNISATTACASELLIVSTPSVTPSPGARQLEVAANVSSPRPDSIPETASGTAHSPSSSSMLSPMNSFATLRVAMEADDTSLFAPLQQAMVDLIKTGRSFGVRSRILS